MKDRPAGEFWLPLVCVMVVHALLVSVTVGLIFSSLYGLPGGRPGVDNITDMLVMFLCLPLTPLVGVGRVDLFFILLPLNTVAYSLLFWLPLYAVRRRRRPRRS